MTIDKAGGRIRRCLGPVVVEDVVSLVDFGRRRDCGGTRGSTIGGRGRNRLRF